MKAENNKYTQKHPVRKIVLRILGGVFILLSIGAIYLYFNLNKLLSNALRKNFNATLISDVYELKFEKLSVNFLLGNISVHNVDLQPRENPLDSYPYINSSFILKADKILLGNVRILTLLNSNILKLDLIELTQPEIDFTIDDVNPIFFPFNDTILVAANAKKIKKRSIELFVLKQFKITEASFHVSNTARKREFDIQQINMIVNRLLLDQRPGRDIFSYDHVDLTIGKSSGEMENADLKHISFTDFKLTIDSLNIQRSRDSMIYKFADLNTGISELEIQSEDSIFQLNVKSIDLSYRKQFIKTKDVVFKPNISDAVWQARYPYQHAHVSGSFGSLQILGFQFDSLFHSHKLFIDHIIVDNVSASVFKDKLKPIDTKRFPDYPGQAIMQNSMPILIKQVNATNVNVTSRERKPDGSYGNASIRKGTVEIKHITNLSASEMLTLKGDAYLENKAHFHINVQFSYLKPQFIFDARVDKFNLSDINPLLQSFTPASIKNGTLDEMTISVNGYHRTASGTMKFLYHDLDIDLALKEQAKWKSSVLAFAANAIMPSANPVSADVPPRIVQFDVERDMHKIFVNVILKSLFSGLKETMFMSKENRKDNREAKKEAKRERKKERKSNKN